MTVTSKFGVSYRENHDASEFYERFPTPVISADNTVNPATVHNKIWTGDARRMDRVGKVADNSVALVVTSPPYYAGKEYETAIGEGHVPESYVAYLEMLRDVFAECVRKLEPGGRIAVNVANLGRKPYRSLSADVTNILEELGLLLRGEVIWVKSKAASGNCAWGSFRRPTNPVLRDLTERIVIASKGRFDRKRDAVASITADEFMDLTTDVWEFPPESATRVGHPAPFPVELPRRFIELYTYKGDLVLDPFMGVGSTAVAALRTGRHYVGFDTDKGYTIQARARLREEAKEPRADPQVSSNGDAVSHALRDGRKATDVAQAMLEAAGFRDVSAKVTRRGIPVSFLAWDLEDQPWYFDVVGALSNGQPGLKRTEVLWKAIGKASALQAADNGAPLVLLSVDMPPPRSVGREALDACPAIADVLDLLDIPATTKRLRSFARG